MIYLNFDTRECLLWVILIELLRIIMIMSLILSSVPFQVNLGLNDWLKLYPLDTGPRHLWNWAINEINWLIRLYLLYAWCKCSPHIFYIKKINILQKQLMSSTYLLCVLLCKTSLHFTSILCNIRYKIHRYFSIK